MDNASIIDCDEKPVEVKKTRKASLEEELKSAYCHKCLSPELKIIKIIKIECQNCGRKRLITEKIGRSKR
ncbi:MAG: hypothetical protein N3E38_03345 [Candidatus Aenigmarchaeota archaeon]|nr:hypothetical protein [Candidatus Aenigmarchaeota archaeon]